MTFYAPSRLLILKRESLPLRRNLASETTSTNLRGDGQSFDHLHQQNAVLAGVFKVHGVREGVFPRTNMNPLQGSYMGLYATFPVKASASLAVEHVGFDTVEWA